MKRVLKILLASALAVVIGLAMFFAFTHLLEPKNPSKALPALLTTPPSTTFPTAQGVCYPFQLTVTLDNTSYVRGEPLNLTVTVTNTSNQTRSFSYDDPDQGFGFQVFNSTHSMIRCVPKPNGWAIFESTLWLDANASHTEFWNELEDAIFPASGTYYVVGTLTTHTFNITTTSLQITIT